jgi:arsenate reductase
LTGTVPAGQPALPRRLLAEGLGTGLLAAAVVGSGTAAARLSPGDDGLALLENSIATGTALAVLIVWLGPVSGAHLNPVVSVADWWVGRGGTGPTGRDTAAYVGAQTVGAVLGVAVAHLMFGLPVVEVAGTVRSGGGTLLAEVVATAGLVALVLALSRTGRAGMAGPAVGAYIAAAYWFTSSTSFANPALTLGRMLTDTPTGIAPGSVPTFLLGQLAGAALGVAVATALQPDIRRYAADVLVPHSTPETPARRP